jgi:hypothetical protein
MQSRAKITRTSRFAKAVLLQRLHNANAHAYHPLVTLECELHSRQNRFSRPNGLGCRRVVLRSDAVDVPRRRTAEESFNSCAPQQRRTIHCRSVSSSSPPPLLLLFLLVFIARLRVPTARRDNLARGNTVCLAEVWNWQHLFSQGGA